MIESSSKTSAIITPILRDSLVLILLIINIWHSMSAIQYNMNVSIKIMENI